MLSSYTRPYKEIVEIPPDFPRPYRSDEQLDSSPLARRKTSHKIQHYLWRGHIYVRRISCLSLHN